MLDAVDASVFRNTLQVLDVDYDYYNAWAFRTGLGQVHLARAVAYDRDGRLVNWLSDLDQILQKWFIIGILINFYFALSEAFDKDFWPLTLHLLNRTSRSVSWKVWAEEYL